MGVSNITYFIFIAVTVLALLIIGLTFVRWRKLRKAGLRLNRRKKAGASVLSLLLIITVVANLAINTFHNIINQHFSVVKVDDVQLNEATAAAENMAKLLEEEGIVLLENKGKALPLDTETNGRVNVFGMQSINLIYGGSGSGASDESENITLQQGLEQAGFSVNGDLTEFYEQHAPEKSDTNIFNLKGGDYNIYEPEVSEYSDELLNDAKAFSDTAVVVISRSGGEGGDLPLDMADYEGGDAGEHYLKLQKTESEMLAMVEENFGTVIVVINSSNAMELGFLEDERVDAAIWIGGPGSTGCIAVGEVMSGQVNPSGRLADIYAYDLTGSPAYYNAGDFTYISGGENTKYKYVDYQEGIYVGYRYYETRYVDNLSGECDEDAYHAAVQYPFGYGLSYTEFTKEIQSHSEKDGVFTLDIKVENVGNVSGKEVVQVYFSAPYTIGGIEKSEVSLAAFGKTDVLEPGASETVTLSFTMEDMASYDYQNTGSYVLESGTYEIKLMDNSHDVIDSFNYDVEESVVYDEANPRSTDKEAAENRFENADGNLTYVSRADWEGTLPTERIETKEISEEDLYSLQEDNIEEIYCSDADSGTEDIVTGADNGLILEDMVGVAYDNEKWDLLLDELTLEEMCNLIGYGGFSTVSVESIQKAATIDIDGPAGLNALTSDISGTQFPSEVVIASAFNQELASEMGVIYANEAAAHGVTGLYAPAVNIHRTPFSGRNFEYYSEDAVLSGKMGAAVVRGAGSRGIYTYVKHFALNDQETNRSGASVWSNEQAIREIYLKAFEIVVKEGGTSAMMSSYNRIGTEWTGGSYTLLTEVLRNEWGFEGMVVTDYDNGSYMNVDQSIRAGGDLMLSTLGDAPTSVSTSTNTGKQAVRRAAKNILYTIVNSRAYTDPVTTEFPYWLIVQAAADAALLLAVFIGLTKLTAKKE